MVRNMTNVVKLAEKGEDERKGQQETILDKPNSLYVISGNLSVAILAFFLLWYIGFI